MWLDQWWAEQQRKEENVIDTIRELSGRIDTLTRKLNEVVHGLNALASDVDEVREKHTRLVKANVQSGAAAFALSALLTEEGIVSANKYHDLRQRLVDAATECSEDPGPCHLTDLERARILLRKHGVLEEDE